MTTATEPAVADRPAHADDGLATVAVALGVAGLLPILPILGSLAAVVCGGLALSSIDATGPAAAASRHRAQGGIALGVVGLVAPLVALFVYCVVLGYPFPLHRYQPGG